MKTAMILAAGRGERLKPLTKTCPKAMCRVQGMPLIEYHVSNLASAGFEKIIVNHAYLGSQIRHHLQDGSRWGVDIHYSPEPPGGLETGGGIINALPLLGNTPFLTVNADIFTDFDFSNIQLPKGSLAHLVLVDNPAHNSRGDFGLNEYQKVSNEDKKYTYSGIACYHPQFFDRYEPGRFSVTPLWRENAVKGLISGEHYAGSWIDIGSLERWHLANQKQGIVGWALGPTMG
ncbi:N-acetylmuramate alpha-1-phosphate uridylyltransferase MurU [Legionella sp. 16cNR16C]|uniref:N-acetylmuramate alpha-1-phosphate uridylyltransferase MurU n=1 Tax=Legionella sp. 16cNR16C TaxID=2905656 RepID=UPI001E42EA90|nr:nucleotidyltransferase family protein [Legionella sp. 16cNR16C]MCE3045553.1 nucleotidyltransferase family protein [Legionella sp. 16cNR16C]